jgi:hypothetical protein
MVRFYIDCALVFALAGLVDYLFLDEAFWTRVDVGALARAKGYFATAGGALPENMYSWFFGRRAFGLAFNPLNLAYMLIPAMIFAYPRRLMKRFVILAVAFVLTFSRLPFLATVVVVALARASRAIRYVLFGLGAIALVVGVYVLQDTVFADPSTRSHLIDVTVGLVQQVLNPTGEGIGAAGVYAGNYSELAVESAVLNTASQISIIGLIAYVLVFVPGIAHPAPLTRELRIVAAIYGLTAFLAPQVLVIKSTFAFFFFMGCNAALAQRSLPVRTRSAAAGQHVGLG